VAGALGLRLVEPEGWTCCGSSAAHGQDHVAAMTMPMRNLALMEKSGFAEVVAPCSACYFRFRSALHDVRADRSLGTEALPLPSRWTAVETAPMRAQSRPSATGPARAGGLRAPAGATSIATLDNAKALALRRCCQRSKIEPFPAVEN